MKDKIRSLLGIEMSLYGWEFKPILLVLGVLLFIALSIPLLIVYVCLYIKSTLLKAYKDIKNSNNNDKNRPLRRV